MMYSGRNAEGCMKIDTLSAQPLIALIGPSVMLNNSFIIPTTITTDRK